MKIQCQSCNEPAVIHITEIDETSNVKDIHLCYKCAQVYLHENEATPSQGTMVTSTGLAIPAMTSSTAECPHCHMTFAEFRSTARLGCPHDYEVFRAELLPLLKNIHDGVRHIGKLPQRLPVDSQIKAKLLKLRQELQQAIAVEDYERAAALRDEIDHCEKNQP